MRKETPPGCRTSAKRGAVASPSPRRAHVFCDPRLALTTSPSPVGPEGSPIDLEDPTRCHRCRSRCGPIGLWRRVGLVRRVLIGAEHGFLGSIEGDHRGGRVRHHHVSTDTADRGRSRLGPPESRADRGPLQDLEEITGHLVDRSEVRV